MFDDGEAKIDTLTCLVTTWQGLLPSLQETRMLLFVVGNLGGASLGCG